MEEKPDRAGQQADVEPTAEPATDRWGPSLPVVVGAVVVYLALGLGLAAIGGWAGIVAVLCLVALVIAGVVRAAAW